LASEESLTVFFGNGIFCVLVMVFSTVGDGLADAFVVVDPSAIGLDPVDSVPSFAHAAVLVTVRSINTAAAHILRIFDSGLLPETDAVLLFRDQQ
jgi:hypothetical protein